MIMQVIPPPPLTAIVSVSLNPEMNRNVLWTLVKCKHVQINKLMSRQLLLVIELKLKTAAEAAENRRRVIFSCCN